MYMYFYVYVLLGMGVGAFLPYFNANDPKTKQKTQSGNILDHLSIGPYLRFEIKNVKINTSIITSLMNRIVNNIYINCNTTLIQSYQDIKVYFIEKKYLNQTSFRPPVPTFSAFTINRNFRRRKILKRKKSKTHSAVSTLHSYVKNWTRSIHINNKFHHNINNNNTIYINKNFSMVHNNNNNGHITTKKNNTEKHKKNLKKKENIHEYNTDKDRKSKTP